MSKSRAKLNSNLKEYVRLKTPQLPCQRTLEHKTDTQRAAINSSTTTLFQTFPIRSRYQNNKQTNNGRVLTQARAE